MKTSNAAFQIIGDDQKLNRAIDVAMRVASTEVTVLVLGENGVGKDVFSRIIHQMSPRKHKKFIAINAGAIPEGTIDSELVRPRKRRVYLGLRRAQGLF